MRFKLSYKEESSTYRCVPLKHLEKQGFFLNIIFIFKVTLLLYVLKFFSKTIHINRT